MAKKPIPGLILRGGIWHIQKVVKGVGGVRRRLRESTGEREIEKAEAESYPRRKTHSDKATASASSTLIVSYP